jgi:hypothetical protein
MPSVRGIRAFRRAAKAISPGNWFAAGNHTHFLILATVNMLYGLAGKSFPVERKTVHVSFP